MKRSDPESAVRQRILTTARDLFYRQGYKATGINEIIGKSKVAKASFYAYFPSKVDLAIAYVQTMNEEEIRVIEEGLKAYRGPQEKLMGLIEFLIPWSKERDYRGCAYLNISSEILDPAHPVRRESIAHYDAMRRLVLRLVHELKEKRGASWRNRDPEAVASDYLLVFFGALAMAQVYHHAKPFQNAQEAVRRLLS